MSAVVARTAKLRANHGLQRSLCAKAKRGDRAAAGQLIRLNMGIIYETVYSVRREHPDSEIADMVQDGCIGLLRAVRKFRARWRNSFITYAEWWIRSSIVKGADERAMRLAGAFSLHNRRGAMRSDVARLRAEGVDRDGAVRHVAAKRGVTEAKLVEVLEYMDQRFEHIDAVGLEGGGSSAARSGYLWEELVPSNEVPSDALLEAKQQRFAVNEVIGSMRLDRRERAILGRRLMAETPARLCDIGDMFGLSKERVRQIEASLLKRLRVAMRAHRQFQEAA